MHVFAAFVDFFGVRWHHSSIFRNCSDGVDWFAVALCLIPKFRVKRSNLKLCTKPKPLRAVSDSAKKTTGRWEALGMGVGENSGILGTKWVTSGRQVVPGGSRWKTNGKQGGNRRKTGC